MVFAIRSSLVHRNGVTSGRILTRFRLIMILVAYTAFNVGVYYGTSFQEDKRFWKTVINIVTASFTR